MHPLIQLHGSTHPLPETVRLRAGKLNLVYSAGFLRYIKVGNTEVLRMINHYVRDQNWTTIPMTINDEKIERDTSSFNIVYKALCLQGDIHFQWNCRIVGKEDSTITFEIEGEALHTFKRNRLGFTVLHPTKTCSGKECVIVHPDNNKEILIFPEFIDPYQPFLDVAGMQWEPSKGIEAVLHFEGEVFETEDQRNWNDATFKTYCTPLLKPLPAIVKKGDGVSQAVHFKVKTDPTFQETEKKQITFTVDKKNATAFPQVGITLSDLSHDAQILQWIKELNIDFLRIELYSNDTEISFRLRQALEIGLPLELVLFLEREFNPEFIYALLPLKDRIKQIIVLPAYSNCTDEELIERAVPLLRKNFPRSKIGGGTDAFFTELNRERTPPDLLDFLSFSINPQMHAVDMATLTENLATHQDAVTSCRMFAGGKDIHVGPVTLKMRWNPSGTIKGEKKTEPGIVPTSVDPRQLSLYGAAWTMGSFKYLAQSNVGAITFYETCGWKGLVPHPEQSWPGDFLFPQNAAYPVYIILKEILQHKQSRVAKLFSSDPLLVDGMTLLDRKGNETIMLANYTDSSQPVTLPSNNKSGKLWSLHAGNVLDMMLNPKKLRARHVEINGPIVLPPFSFTVLE